MFFGTAYEKLGLPLYVVGFDSYEILYINDEGKKLLGDIVGLKCHEALNDTKTPCKNCISTKKLLQCGSCCTKTQYLAHVKKYVDVYQSVMELSDGLKGRVCLIVDVTDQENFRQENEKREKASKNMRHLIDIQSGFIKSAKSMMTAATMDGRMIFVNKSMSEALGYTEEEMLSMSIADFHPPEVAHDFKEKYIPQALSEGMWKGDCTILKKDGSEMPVRQSVFPIHDELGEIIATAAIMNDITKELELERMNSYQLAIMDSSVNYIGVSDLQGNTMYHSPGAYRMLGYEPGEVGEWQKKAYHPDWYNEKIFNEGIPTAMKEGIWKGRGELIDRYGKHIPIEQSIFPVFDSSRKPMGMATIIDDITEKVKHEKEIESARQTLRAIIDTTPSAVFWKDKNSCFLGVNKKFAIDAGVNDPDKLVGLSDYDLYPKELADIYVAEDKKIFKTGKELFHVEESFQGLDGVINWISTSKVLIRNENGEPYALLGIYDDITRLKQNEMKLNEAIRAAEEASQAKSDFLSRMSHEIRTPMNAILGMTKIGKATDDIERIRYCLDRVDAASKHLLGLINDILDMSKIEANKLKIVEESFSLEKMMENICNIISVKAEEKRQNLYINVSDNVPDMIVSDEMRIAQIITNLLSNAIKFTAEEGVIRADVSYVEERADRGRLSVSVTDTGIGLSEEQQNKLFNPFEQAEVGISKKYGGTGLGLAISKRIVEMMGGQISVYSKLGEGSIFTFTVVVQKCSTSKPRTVSGEYKDVSALVVSDNENILDNLGQFLKSSGVKCEFTSRREETISRITKRINENSPYNIMFIDSTVRKISGIDITRETKAIAGDSLRVVLLCQIDYTKIEEEARAAGVSRFVTKPLFRQSVLECINQLVLQKKEEEEQSVNIGGIFRGVKVLIAEDIDINREIVASLLEETGISIEFAVNGAEAVRMFTESPYKYDIIIMDIQMPIMDGIEATRRIRASDTSRSKTIPIIAMTANAFAEDVELCKNAGMMDHICKPVDLDVIVSKLRHYLRHV